MNTLIQATSVFAVTIDVITFDPFLFNAHISDIQEGDQNKLYTLDKETGEIIFGDGQMGAPLPVGTGGRIASYYRSGAGASGDVPEGIFETYIVPADFSPFFLPADFFPVQVAQTVANSGAKTLPKDFDSAEAYAEYLADTVELAFPTAVVAHRLVEDDKGDIDFSFVVSGITSLEFKIVESRMWITDVKSVPEPGTMLLLGSGLLGLLAGRKTFRRTDG